jgi:PGF-pre-PGF domain-containing protein
LTVTSVVPGEATLTVDTTPIKANVYVDNSLWGTAPQTRSLDAGTYTVLFGDYLGYLAPAPQTVTLAENETRTVTGVYTAIPTENIESQSPTYEVPPLGAGENATITVENTAISEIVIWAENNISGARITVQQLTGRPAEIAIGPPGTVYKYLNIVAENVIDAQIGSVVISFKVEKSWITANGIDMSTIALYRYDLATGEWTPLPTTYLSEDDTYAYFSAVSPGLSVFAVTGTPVAPPLPWMVYVVGIGLIVLIIVIICLLAYRHSHHLSPSVQS